MHADVEFSVQVTKHTKEAIVLAGLQIPYSKEAQEDMLRYQLKLNCWKQVEQVEAVQGYWVG